jgi:lysozyme family protein
MDLAPIIAENQALWEKAIVPPAKQRDVRAVALRLTQTSAKNQYLAIAPATRVPWWVIAVIHERESGQDFQCQLGQGDPLNRISRHVPRGRGPFLEHLSDAPYYGAFYRCALDALINCPPYATRWTDWSAGGTLTLLELYNGLGYEYRHEHSPYIWGATNQEQPGKFTGDGIYSKDVWDTQIGCAAMLKSMMEIDDSIVMPAPAPWGLVATTGGQNAG